jgi:4-diphosphocytidyl-2-C-methyl-D-erythritol kinase
LTDPGFAPAKVNLYLHVGPPGPDGFHPLSSLVVFADVGDRVTLARADQPRFLVQGPFAPALDRSAHPGASGDAGSSSDTGLDPDSSTRPGRGPADLALRLRGDEGILDSDNLVLRAVQAFARAFGRPVPPLAVVLDKQLPIAAGLGGGSSDGAAALRLLARAFGEALDDPRLVDAAEALGADGVMCLHARSAIAEGRGERLSPAPILPELHAVLANPGVPSPTGAVYRAYDEAPHPSGAGRPPTPERFEGVEPLAAWLSATRNDLETAAVRLQPPIGDALALLRVQPESLVSRMSGSGATCFALCRDATGARALAERLESLTPSWWIRACRLG